MSRVPIEECPKLSPDDKVKYAEYLTKPIDELTTIWGKTNKHLFNGRTTRAERKELLEFLNALEIIIDLKEDGRNI